MEMCDLQIGFVKDMKGVEKSVLAEELKGTDKRIKDFVQLYRKRPIKTMSDYLMEFVRYYDLEVKEQK